MANPHQHIIDVVVVLDIREPRIRNKTPLQPAAHKQGLFVAVVTLENGGVLGVE